ncbi:MAG: NPCBM/NEW2 domain-containing protein [Planctomycetota bacterium]|nr:NPCBM/NEW2 domain-containing protein [Planctomycetota bacterium]
MRKKLIAVLGSLICSILIAVGLGCQAERNISQNSQSFNTMWLDELDVSKAESGWSSPKRNKSVEGKQLSVGGEKFEHGLGTHAADILRLNLHGDVQRFTALVGVDDEVFETGKAGVSSVEFKVIGDGRTIWSSGIMKAGDKAKKVDVDLRGVKKMNIVVGDGGDGNGYDHADWVDAKFEAAGKKPEIIYAAVEPYILTPKPPKTPRINGAKVFGVRCNSPLLYTIPATGERPIVFGADNLPVGLSLDANTGKISGKVAKASEYLVTLRAKNTLGQTSRQFRIVVGDKICLTPPMGWNSWNCWAKAVDADKIRAAAKAMHDSGLASHGWTYINIDDAWQGSRGGEFNAIQGNEKFHDIYGLCDYVHSLGLKVGIYSTPWVTSYAGFIGGSSNEPNGAWSKDSGGGFGKYSFATNDAKQWAAWGIDYLKYDWNPNDSNHVMEMAEALKASGRDIVYSLSNTAPFEMASEWVKYANCWRTTGDIIDKWDSVSSIGFSQSRWAEFSGPGHWNDADMLVVGKVGWGPQLHPTILNANEQYTHISLWCLLSSPLLLGCDMTELDEFTLNLLTNDEVLAVNQDAMGKQAICIAKYGDNEVWAKDMEDGSKAVGIFNRSDPYKIDIEKKTVDVTIQLSELGLKGKRTIRDLWRQKDIGIFEKEFKTKVPIHGVVLVQIFPK